MTCNFYLWSGSGYCLDGPFSVSDELLKKDDLQFALELLSAYLIENKETAYYLTEEEYSALCDKCGYNPDEHDGDDLEGWCYVDGTMEGAKYPIYIRTENLRFEFVS